MRLMWNLHVLVFGALTMAAAPGCSAGGNPAGSGAGGTSGDPSGVGGSGADAAGGDGTGAMSEGSGGKGAAPAGGGTSTGAVSSTGASSGAGGPSTGGVSALVQQCTNGQQDGDEEGVDCGGSCPSCEANYRLDAPPDPCTNHFWVDGCVEGSLTSACGGVCQVANACSPPEDPSKSGLPKTFACPRFMLFSVEMMQAAEDDAALYGWGDSDDPPFNYAVVGHDADTGGLDVGLSSSCCQCYQLVFETPEPSSPQPPELPIPKPLIVQSFNTAAGGGNNFDVFMAAGGYGAFNACYNDPTFDNTTTFGSFLYDSFPSENPGNGGIKFLNYEECRGTSWPPTIADVQSEACRSRIATLCDQAVAVSGALPSVTISTRDSCVQANQAESLYHQNWQVRAKRVECPESLTHVTGCRLVPSGLPAPDPAVQSAAIADASFLTGYTTTTMQDCCKPTCAWTDWVEGQGLVADGEHNSFYSCDALGNPLVKH